MPYSILQNKIEEKLSQLKKKEQSIVVLKGIPMEAVEPKLAEKINLETLVSNKIGYLFSNMSRKFWTYEEFLLLNEFLVSQYQSIYILNNNLYMDQYPLELNCSEAVRQGLLNYFLEVDDDSQDELSIGNVEEYAALFVGLKENNGLLLGVYCDENILSNNKIISIPLFEIPENSPGSVTSAQNFVDLTEESDYVELIKKMLRGPEELYIRVTNYAGDIHKLESRIGLLAENWADYTDFFYVRPAGIEENIEPKPEYKEILKRYWGYDSFRNLPVYDMGKLQNGEKEVKYISQENIITNIVAQVEKCEGKDGSYRDVFVTAPTGAGKSVMFQIPAIYLAEKYNLLTIVISPLIGLMNDQVKNLELKNYQCAKTINSDISPLVKQDIIDKVAAGEYHILYISPETLLSRSDVEQLIGQREIGMIVIDEAHIATTWGKQFRPDYWYLGDHISKLRKRQMERHGRSFLLATFTATAIYGGFENMYSETINSLHMTDPITYLGYIKRKDIEIKIDKIKKDRSVRNEYELGKLQAIEEEVKRAVLFWKKTLIYFPTVALIDSCYDYLISKGFYADVAVYYGPLDKNKKSEAYLQFRDGKKPVMLATKAFGMGVDINDIERIIHYAPTGNVCDYVQEIGRAARKESLDGVASYQYDSRDFKFINRLHGLSAIKRYQLVEIIKKIDELYANSLKKGGRDTFTRRRNAMLLDAETFSYIFPSVTGDEDGNNINKVKTALLIIQKDFESKLGFSPIVVRPIPLFSVGFFEIPIPTQKKLLRKYHDCLEVISEEHNICRVDLNRIWNKSYSQYSFPKFKYLLYSKDKELEFNMDYDIHAALCVSIVFTEDYRSSFKQQWESFRAIINRMQRQEKFFSLEDIKKEFAAKCGISSYKAETVCEVFLASMESYQRNFSKGHYKIVTSKPMNSGKVSYHFVDPKPYFDWVEKLYHKILDETKNGEMYLVDYGSKIIKEISTVLGILDAMDILSFQMLGGANSQLYIYINQSKSMKTILNAPQRYHNRLLDSVGERHLVSVKMLTYLYEGQFTSEERWDLLEDYFLGKIPEKVKRECQKENENIKFE